MMWAALAWVLTTFAAFFAGLQTKRLPNEPDNVVTVDTRPLDTPSEAQNGPVSDEENCTVPSTVPGTVPAPAGLSWETPKGAFKLTRIMADEMGLTVEQKDILCACIFQESRFQNRYADGRPVTNENKVDGKLWSTDWGIAQVNDTKGWHIGPGLAFPSVEFVLEHPEEAIRYMIRMQKAGKLTLWSSYKFAHYNKWLVPTSPMWGLRS